MAQVFISYKREEKSSDFVIHMKEKLEAAGFDVWIDQSLLRPGQQWIQEIDNAIKASIALIVVLTPEAHTSLYVTYEWSFAVGRGMEVIPLLLEDTEIHRRLQDIQYIDFRNHWSLPWDDLIDRLYEIETGQTSKRKEVPPFVQRAIDALDSYDLEDRKAAINRLTQSNHPAAIEALANAVQHHVDDVRIYAGLKLAEVTECRDERAIAGLIEGLRMENPYQQAITTQIINYSNSSIPGLLETLEDEWSEARKSAAYALGQIKALEAVPRLGELVISDKEISSIAMDALEKIGDLRSLPIAVKVLTDTENFSFHCTLPAVQLLSKIGEPIVAVPLLIKAWRYIYVRDPNTLFYHGEAARAVESALAQIGEPAVPSLLEILRESTGRSRQSILEILTIIGSSTALDDIAQYIQDEDIFIRIKSIEALLHISDMRVIPILINILRNHPQRIENVMKISGNAGKRDNFSWKEEELSLKIVATLKNYGTPEALDAVKSWSIEYGSKDI